jgi:concanavalin A-like lectin/glucanase superfamily protein
VVTADPDRVETERVGVDEFPGAPSDTCFQYLLNLDRDEFFWQSQYLDSTTTDRVFWISITAVYVGASEPDYVWGWKTRPQPWMDGAVSFAARRDELRAGITTDSAGVEPVTNSLVCERLDRYDMAFELDTDPDYIKWEQPFTGLRHWAYYEDELSLATIGSAAAAKWTQSPDTTTAGMAIDITKDIPPTWPEQIAGDDFQCTTTGPVTGISLWGAWYHDILPSNSADNATFTLTIRADIPADRSGTGYSMPGEVLWRKEFKPGEFTVRPQEARTQSFYSPGNETFEQNTHLMVYKYSFEIDTRDAFEQTGTPSQPKVYWLCAQTYLVHSPGSVATRFGWQASSEHWNDDGVWVLAEEPYRGTGWGELVYPRSHPSASRSVDLAFEIETEEAGSGLTYRRLVADDWQCNSPTPITGLAWWGSYIGYGYQSCDCTQMTPPVAPDYFLLSIWTDAPDPTPGDPATFGYPAQKIWEYRTDSFDEVLVGFDRHPDALDTDMIGFEPVYRYTVRLPQEDWFCQESARDVYWLSVVAVYEDAEAMIYPWGWTNHPHTAWDLSGLKTLAHWKMDESTGTTAADSSGNGNDATLIGTLLWHPDGGYLGGAIELGGRPDYLKVEKPQGFDFAPGSFSVSAWVYPHEVRGRWQAIMEYDRTSTNGNRFGLWIDTQGRFHFRVGLNTWQSTQTLAANQWHSLMATYDSDTYQMNLYVNGILDGTATQDKGFVAPIQATLTIGVRGDEKGEFFNGLLDEVRVFGAALRPEDVLTLVGAGRNNDAVAGVLRPDSTASTWQWTELYDATGTSEDMSFMLFTEPRLCNDGKAAEQDDGSDKKDTTTTDDSEKKS